MDRRSGNTAPDNDVLPLLPGYRAHIPGELTRNRPQICNVSRGLAGMVLKGQPASPKKGSNEYQPGMHAAQAGRPQQATAFLDNPPAWLAYDRKVLRFNAYFTERIEGCALENWRVRRCHLLLYLEDSSLQITEPHEPNSGLRQGTLLRRGRVNLPATGLLTWRDLSVGGNLKLYGHTYHLLGCDAFTRSWLQQQGSEQPPDSDWPEGPYDTAKKAEKEWQQYSAHNKPPPLSPKPRASGAPLQQALYQGKVLRFYCCWAADSGGSRDAPLPYVLHYYLADDCVEVREVHPRNDGRYPFPMLLSKRRLPKNIPPVGARPLSAGSRDAQQQEYYVWQELRLGMTVHVYGRELLVLDCDEFTRSWYMQNEGLSSAQLQPVQVDFDLAPRAPTPEVPASWIGVGREEDAAQSVFRLVPRPLMEDGNRRLAQDGLVLRFVAQLVLPPGYPAHMLQDADRRFVLGYYLADDTMSVYEPVQRNSGQPGGMFLERGRIPRPGSPTAQQEGQQQAHQQQQRTARPASSYQSAYKQPAQQYPARPGSSRPTTAPQPVPPGATPPRMQYPFLKDIPPSAMHPQPQPVPSGAMAAAALAARVATTSEAHQLFYTDADLWVGARLHIYGRVFELKEADEFTIKLMERSPDRYPCADAAKVVPDIASALQPHSQQLLQFLELGNGGDFFTADALHDAMQRVGVQRSLHEAITFCRACSGSSMGLGRGELRAALAEY